MLGIFLFPLRAFHWLITVKSANRLTRCFPLTENRHYIILLMASPLMTEAIKTVHRFFYIIVRELL